MEGFAFMWEEEKWRAFSQNEHGPSSSLRVLHVGA